MPRPASVAVGGYYPTPAELIPDIAGLIDSSPALEFKTTHYDKTWGDYLFLDPCAGDGSALFDLIRAMFLPNNPSGNLHQLSRGNGPTVKAIACEMERGRFKALEKKLPAVMGQNSHQSKAVYADAFNLVLGNDYSTKGANVLYLNPPYDFDRLHGRLEQRFLARFTQALILGEGLLLFVVPYYALAASASFLAQNYEKIACYRFPDDAFESFKQVVLVARRVSSVLKLPVEGKSRAELQILGWAEDASTIPVLPNRDEVTFGYRHPLHSHSHGGLSNVEVAGVDLEALTNTARPWQVGACSRGDSTRLKIVSESGLDKDYSDFIGQPYPVAMPPKPTHIALALTVGAFNGKRIEPNSGTDAPPILLKGVFKKELVTYEEVKNKDGDVTGRKQLEAPQLTITALCLNTFTYHEIKPVSAENPTPTGSTNIGEMNVLDILTFYSQALSRLMAEQFPPLHHPAKPEQALHLAEAGRKPFQAQSQAVQGLLKLLGRGINPFLIGEVGTGKTTMALLTAWAMSEANYRSTVAQLRAQEVLTTPLRPVKNTLVVCPPHLLSTWKSQVEAVLPGAKVVIVESLADLPG